MAVPAPNFGLLSKLTGEWVGSGFNFIALPKFNPPPSANPKPNFQTKLAATKETLTFSPLTDLSSVPNRGDVAPDLFLSGLSYMQVVFDRDAPPASGAIHREPGLWLHFGGATTKNDTYVRQAVIPHGNSLIAQSSFATSVKTPVLNPVQTKPFNLKPGQAIPGLNDVASLSGAPLDYTEAYTNPPSTGQGSLPKGISKEMLLNPVLLLQEQIKGQNIVETDVIQISTANPGGLLNIPFLQANAKAIQMDAIFWIERIDNVKPLQLQYVQRVLLDFDNIIWPHVSVATLTQQLPKAKH